MCGIAGIFADQPGCMPVGVALAKMIRAIGHRGPDETGIHADGTSGIGHARLSIIDLSSGQQPMTNEDETLWVTFNGEIFNYVEMREELIKRGHVFRTHSDTEVILHQYEEKGIDGVLEMNGDFAFAVWDKRRRRLVMARDRMGVRPIYFTEMGGRLAFASEVKALLALPGVRAELDPEGLDQCFTFWHPIAPRTVFKGIQELPPGHVLIAEGGAVTMRPYWRLNFPERGEHAGDTRDAGELAEELEALLLDATRIRLRADVPVAAYLSGGLDSSCVTALIKQLEPSVLRTFSVCFENKEFDESAFQQDMVRALETQHQSVMCSQDSIAENFLDVIRHTERPVLRTAPTPMYMLARLVRQNGIKVVMTGEGADEILGGYDIFKEAKVRRFWGRKPESPSRAGVLRKLYPYMSGIQAQSPAYLKAFFGAGLSATGDPFFSHMPRWNLTAKIKEFFSDGMRETLAGVNALEGLRGQLPAEFSRWHPLSQAQYLETTLLMPGYILSSQGDRVSMAHAVESRFPFLDPRVIDFAAKLPPRMKLHGLDEKYLLRQSVGRKLPESVGQRRKQPYRAPDSESFFAGKTPAYVEEMLSPRAIGDAGYFDPQAVGRLVQKCRTQKTISTRDNMALVGILSTQILHHVMMRSPADAQTVGSTV